MAALCSAISRANAVSSPAAARATSVSPAVDGLTAISVTRGRCDSSGKCPAPSRGFSENIEAELFAGAPALEAGQWERRLPVGAGDVEDVPDANRVPVGDVVEVREIGRIEAGLLSDPGDRVARLDD